MWLLLRGLIHSKLAHWKIRKVAVLRGWLLLRGSVYSKSTLWKIRKVAVKGPWLLLRGSIHSKLALWKIRKVAVIGPCITKTCLFKYIENFTSKNWKFSDKNLWYFPYFCSKHRLWYSLELPHRGGSNEYPQSMFLSRNKKNNAYPRKPQFYYIKVGFKGVNII